MGGCPGRTWATPLPRATPRHDAALLRLSPHASVNNLFGMGTATLQHGFALVYWWSAALSCDTRPFRARAPLLPAALFDAGLCNVARFEIGAALLPQSKGGRSNQDCQCQHAVLAGHSTMRYDAVFRRTVEQALTKDDGAAG